MNTVVVYDSQFGNTEQLAQTIAETLREWGQCALSVLNTPILLDCKE